MKVRIIICILAAFLLLGSSPWEGAAAVAPEGVLPSSGFFVATNSFPRNTIVEITNIETGMSTTAIVANTLDSPGLLAIVSREAAELINMRQGSISRIRMIAPQEPIAYQRFIEGLISETPSFDSGNVIRSEDDLLAEIYNEDQYRPPSPTARFDDPPTISAEERITGPSYIPEPEWGGNGRLNIVDIPGFTEEPYEYIYIPVIDEPVYIAEEEEPAPSHFSTEEHENVVREETIIVVKPEEEIEKEPEYIVKPESEIIDEPEHIVKPDSEKIEEPEYIAETKPEPEPEEIIKDPEYIAEVEPEPEVIKEPEYIAEVEPEPEEIEEPEYIVEAEPELEEVEEPEYIAEVEPESEEVEEPEYIVEAEPEPEEIEEPEYIAEVPEPEEIEEPEYIVEAEPEPEVIEEPEYIAEVEPEPEVIEEPEYIVEAEPEPEVIEEPEYIVEAEPELEVIEEAQTELLHPVFIIVETPDQPPPQITINLEDILPPVITQIETPEPSQPIVVIEPIDERRIQTLDREKYYVQIAADRSYESAQNLASRIDQNYNPFVFVRGDNWYRVLIGPLNNPGEGAAVLQRFRTIGYSDAFILQGS